MRNWPAIDMVFRLKATAYDPISPKTDEMRPRACTRPTAPDTTTPGETVEAGTPDRTQDGFVVPCDRADSEISQTSQNVKPRSKWWRPNRKPVPGRYKPRPPSTARELMMEYLKSDAFEASIQAEKARARGW